MDTVAPEPDDGQQLSLSLFPPPMRPTELPLADSGIGAAELAAACDTVLEELGEALREYRACAGVSINALEQQIRTTGGLRIPPSVKRGGGATLVGPLVRRKARMPGPAELEALISHLAVDAITAERWRTVATRWRAAVSDYRAKTAAPRARGTTPAHGQVVRTCLRCDCDKDFQAWPGEDQQYCSRRCKALDTARAALAAGELRQALHDVMKRRRKTLHGVARDAGILPATLRYWYVTTGAALTAPILRRLADYLGIPYEAAKEMQGGMTGEERRRANSLPPEQYLLRKGETKREQKRFAQAMKRGGKKRTGVMKSPQVRATMKAAAQARGDSGGGERLKALHQQPEFEALTRLVHRLHYHQPAEDEATEWSREIGGRVGLSAPEVRDIARQDKRLAALKFGNGRDPDDLLCRIPDLEKRYTAGEWGNVPGGFWRLAASELGYGADAPAVTAVKHSWWAHRRTACLSCAGVVLSLPTGRPAKDRP